MWELIFLMKFFVLLTTVSSLVSFQNSRARNYCHKFQDGKKIQKFVLWHFFQLGKNRSFTMKCVILQIYRSILASSRVLFTRSIDKCIAKKKLIDQKIDGLPCYPFQGFFHGSHSWINSLYPYFVEQCWPWYHLPHLLSEWLDIRFSVSGQILFVEVENLH